MHTLCVCELGIGRENDPSSVASLHLSKSLCLPKGQYHTHNICLFILCGRLASKDFYLSPNSERKCFAFLWGKNTEINILLKSFFFHFLLIFTCNSEVGLTLLFTQDYETRLLHCCSQCEMIQS